tara:strand:- start:772 stop:1077 length:306 start_codon:yes stop_codon:yes gene_type:complete
MANTNSANEILLQKSKDCIVTRTSRILSKIDTGLIDECTTMHTWTVLFIDYLLRKNELECLYTCGITPNTYQKPGSGDEYYNNFINFVNQHCDDCSQVISI